MPQSGPDTYAVIYKVTFPNGKIYVGSDTTDDITYWGSGDADYIAADFTREQRRDFTCRKEILWEEKGANISKVQKLERQFILELDSNNPEIGYNKNPKFRQS